MSNIENFDGLCGIIATFSSSDLQIRCHYEFGHGGPCSFQKYKDQFIIQTGCGSAPVSSGESFIESVIESMKARHKNEN
jgi:hypothetical protein